MTLYEIARTTSRWDRERCEETTEWIWRDCWRSIDKVTMTIGIFTGLVCSHIGADIIYRYARMRTQKKVEDSSHNFPVCWQTLGKQKLDWTDISWFEYMGQLTYANQSYPFYRARVIGRSTDAPLNSEPFDDSTPTLKKGGLKSSGPLFHWRRLLFAKRWSLGCSWQKIDNE